MAYQRKTRDVYEIQQDWGYGDGWETVSSCDTRREAIEERKAYRENQPEAPVRIKKVREPIE